MTKRLREQRGCGKRNENSASRFFVCGLRGVAAMLMGVVSARMTKPRHKLEALRLRLWLLNYHNELT